MSELIKATVCPNCKQFFSQNSNICPNCGYRKQKYWNRSSKFLIKQDIFISFIIYFNIFVFLVSLILSLFYKSISYDFFGFPTPNGDVLYKLGMLTPKSLFSLNFYRLLSYSFLHGSVLHLLLNTAWFFYLAVELKKFLPSSYLFLIYLVSAFSGGFFALIFGGGHPVVGSSGAIFGLLGSFMAYGRKRKDFLGFLIWKKFSFLAVAMIIISFFLPNISNSGHIGGVIGGYLFTWFVKSENPKQFLLQKLLLSLGIIILSWGIIKAISEFFV